MTFSKIRRKTIEWLRRYGPAEIIGTLTAFTAAFIVHTISGSYLAAAIAGTWGENVGYYGWFAVGEYKRNHLDWSHHTPIRRIFVAIFVSVRNMLLEFGPAEVLDTFVVRPFLMYVLPGITGSFGVGIIAGKLSADILFYGITICSYEVRSYWIAKGNLSEEELTE